ncbi:hypothetical protein Btru_057418 [Bulinus truncatus]|nr:hypothetical protein Btru_057418 [Bulinus truncatus]
MRSKETHFWCSFQKPRSELRKGFRAYYWAHECPSFKYGLEVCNNTCVCNETNAYSCDNSDGTCHCTVDWTKPDCSEMIPHCKEPSECEDIYEVCVNVPGTFECQCRPGMVRNEKGECEDSKKCVENQCSHACAVTSTNPHQETCYCPMGTRFDPNNAMQCLDCPQWYYGNNCAYYASCSSVGTESYNRANGLCHCYLNFTSSYCGQDADECAFEISPCNLSRSACSNSWGSYECRCHPGYENFDGVVCDDCGKTLTSPSGMILTGILSDNRTKSPNIDCSWQIKVQEGSVISLVFQRYNMLSTCCWWWGGCPSGHVEIFDGSNTNANLLYTSQGSDPSVVLSHLIRTTGSEMYIMRYPAPQCNNYGFDIHYWSHECPVGMFDNNCSTPCTCELSNSRCDSVTGQCICHQGWTSENCTVDVDECSSVTVCPEYSECHNLIGSYDCVCWAGLLMSSSNQCLTDNSTAPCSSRNCSHICVTVTEQDSTTEQCYCPLYMELVGDECVDCLGLKFGPSCQESCPCDVNATASCDTKTGKCKCKSGWTGQSCAEDVNECIYGMYQCPTYSNCINTIGGYRCLCDPILGYTNAEDGSCKLAECHFVLTNDTGEIISPLYPDWAPSNANCTWNITNVRIGGTGGTVCIHATVDKTKTLSCNKTNGLYATAEVTGKGLDCNFVDVDECSLPRRPCNHRRVATTYGSYQCLRFWVRESVRTPMRRMWPNSQRDIWPDLLRQTCQYYELHQICRMQLDNTGSVRCSSFTQYFNLVGGCNDGYLEIYDITNTSSKFLENVLNPSRGRIIRTTGNEMHIIRVPARCSFQYGYQSAGFNATYWTHSCEPFMFNQNCTAPCKCIQNNTDYCNSTTGECLCSDGWYGSDCSSDINECSSPTLCPDYSVCQNLPGSYECKCKEGLKMNLSNICILDNQSTSGCRTRNCSHICVSLTNQSTILEKCYCPNGMELVDDQCIKCRFWKYGPDCERDCTCDVSKTVHCDSVDGSCYCWSNWTGIQCENDFDECLYNKYNCTANSDCKNIYGSYECPCRGQDGYLPYENGTCYHIDCTYDLSNTTGEIKSPQYSSYYYYINNANCSWKITAEKNQVISLWFTEFTTDTYNNCQNDYLKVYDGMNESSRLIGHYCGSGVPSVIRSSGDHMYIVFRSDQYMWYTGGIVGIYKSHECQGFTYGTHSCDNKCQCVKENTASCINTNGECVCKPGWKSRDCSVDVNECLGTNNKVCPPNSDCINTVGSYRCDCHLGYQWDTASQTCYESKECMYKKCSHTCYILQPGVEQCACPDDMELDRSMGLVCFVPLYPYGIDAEDGLLENAYNIFGNMYVTPPIFVSSGAPFGNSVALSLHISSSGAVGFGDGKFNYSLFTDVNIQAQYSESIIAPFMTHINPQTEEKTAYVIYLYHFGKMNWAYTLGRPIIIGVSGPMTQMFGYSNTPYHQEINELYKCPSTLERQGAQWEHSQIKDDEMLYCFVIKPIAKRRFLSENRRNKICCYNQVKPKDESWNEWYKAYREAFYLSGHVLIADPNEYSYLAHQNILAEQKCCADGRYSKSCKRFYKLFPDMGSTDFAEFISALSVLRAATAMRSSDRFVLLFKRTGSKCETGSAAGRVCAVSIFTGHYRTIA